MSPITELVVGPGKADNATFGALILAWREQRNWARRYVAEELGVSHEYLRLIERGKRVPAWGTMPAIFKVFEVDYALDAGVYVFGDYRVEFTSRIREARYKPKKDELHILVTEDRAQQIGRIVTLLVTADDSMLHAVYTRLRRDL